MKLLVIVAKAESAESAFDDLRMTKLALDNILSNICQQADCFQYKLESAST